MEMGAEFSAIFDNCSGEDEVHAAHYTMNTRIVQT